MHTINALLFDLGKVLIHFDYDIAFKQWQAISDFTFDELKAEFKIDEPYLSFERGEITAREYFAHLCKTLHLKEDYSKIASGWRAIFPSEITETRLMVQAARAKLPCYLFSNTNAEHQIAWSTQFPEVVESFERLFVSHEMGCRKPEQKSFDFIANSLGISHSSILFFDDLRENIEGAALAGFQTVHVRSPEDVRITLRKIGCAV